MAVGNITISSGEGFGHRKIILDFVWVDSGRNDADKDIRTYGMKPRDIDCHRRAERSCSGTLTHKPWKMWHYDIKYCCCCCFICVEIKCMIMRLLNTELYSFLFFLRHAFMLHGRLALTCCSLSFDQNDRTAHVCVFFVCSTFYSAINNWFCLGNVREYIYSFVQKLLNQYCTCTNVQRDHWSSMIQ